MRLSTAVLMLLALGGGCARYEYDLIEPQDLARHIGEKADEVAPVDPLVYHLRSYDSHLIVHIDNPTEDPIRLLGDQSTVVDPGGQSHPLRTQTAAPHSFIKLILPPPRPYYAPRSNVSIGFGFGVGHYHHHGGYWGGATFYDPWYWDGPPYYMLYDPGNVAYWEWQGETVVRLNLVYQRGERTFRHAFVLGRKKV
jgi:hypothetical protein